MYMRVARAGERRRCCRQGQGKARLREGKMERGEVTYFLGGKDGSRGSGERSVSLSF